VRNSNDRERYETVDLPFYKDEIAPILPPKVLDFHTHTWTSDHRKLDPYESGAPGAKYVVTDKEYGVERLRADLAMMFPDRPAGAVCFGNPTPAADLVKTNSYLAEAGRSEGLFPLMIAGRDFVPRPELERAIRQGGFFGYKVFLNWYGNDYGSVKISDMIGPAEMSLADELSLIVLLHVPRSGRLADPVVQEGVRGLSKDYPNARIVLAHCGRCYLPDEMKAAVGAVADLDNVYLDTAMVMDPVVLRIALDGVGPSRLLFASDLPVAAMRGRRVYVMDHWVDIVLEGYPASEYRVASDGIHATFMMYEIVLAIRRAAEMVGLSAAETSAIFWDNGISLLRETGQWKASTSA